MGCNGSWGDDTGTTPKAQTSPRRAVLAIERDGLDANLAKWESNLGARVERHLRAAHERNRERARTTEDDLDLSGYRPKAVSS